METPEELSAVLIADLHYVRRAVVQSHWRLQIDAPLLPLCPYRHFNAHRLDTTTTVNLCPIWLTARRPL